MALLSHRTTATSFSTSSRGKVLRCLEATALPLLDEAFLSRIRGFRSAPPLKSHQQADIVSDAAESVVFDVNDMLDDNVSEAGARFQ